MQDGYENSIITDKTTVMPSAEGADKTRIISTSAGKERTGRHSAVSESTGRHAAPERVSGRHSAGGFGPFSSKNSGGRKARMAEDARKETSARLERKTEQFSSKRAKQGLPPEKLKKRGLSKRWIYVICVAVAVIALFVTAAVIRGRTENERYDGLLQTAQEKYDAGDYSSCLTYLRKASSLKTTDETYVLMAACYAQEDNYEKALECLRSVSSLSPEISEKISQMEAARKAENAPDTVMLNGISYPVSTTSLRLDSTGLTNASLKDITALYSLTELSAAGNRISDISPLASLGGLITLDLSSNYIYDVSPLASLTGLRVLYIDSNPVKDLSPLYSLSNLTLLSIRGIELSDEQKTALSEALPNCAIHTEAESSEEHEITLGGSTFSSDSTSITLSCCGITDISTLSACKNLKYADLSGNSISDLTPLMDIPGLETLILSDNSISNIYPLMGITSLKVLYLDGNSVTTLSPVSSLKSLEELYLAGNPLSSCAGLEELNKLSTLDLSNTGITNEMLEQLSACFSLKLLKLDENPALTGDVVDALDKTLKGCRVSHSELPYPVQVGSITVMDNATELDLSNQGITDVSILAKFKFAAKVNLSGNSIANLYSFEYLVNVSKITELDLSSNGLSDINGLSKLVNLEVLNVSYNPIVSIGQLKLLPKLKELYIIGNDFTPEQILELCNALPNCSVHYE